MKNLNPILTIVLLIAVIVLFILHFNPSCNPASSVSSNETQSFDSVAPSISIAYIDVDTLLHNYLFYDDLEGKLLEKQKGMESELNRKMATFEKEATEFQKKVQNGGFLSLESAQRQEQELMEKQQKLLQLKEDLSNQLLLETQKLDKQLLDTVINFLNEFNKDNKYRFILNSSSFLIGDTACNITDTIVKALNLRYESQNGAKTE